MDAKEYDVIVIGGGPGGYTAAIRLAQLGKRTLCVEKESFGGVCLNWGCIPSKALITAAGLVDRIREAGAIGIRAGEPTVDFAATQRWKAGIVERLTSNVGTLIRGNGGETLLGSARIVDAHAVEVTAADGATSVVRAREAIVLGTGARMYQRLGTHLTVVEATDSLLPGLDADLVRVVERRLRKRGGEVLTAARALRWEPRGAGAAVTVEHAGETRVIEAAKVLVAIGFVPNTEGLGLEAVGVRLDARGHVAVDERMMTSVPGIYAVGDMTGGPYLAHKAFREAEVAAEVIAGRYARADWLAMPAAVFTDPEIATVGVSEAEAKRRGLEVTVGRFPFAASGRAMSLDDTEGFIRIIADEQRVIGVQIVGPEASELIAEASFALEIMASPEDVALTIHPHPTLGEGVMEAFKHALGEAVHVMNRRGARRAHRPNTPKLAAA